MPISTRSGNLLKLPYPIQSFGCSDGVGWITQASVGHGWGSAAKQDAAYRAPGGSRTEAHSSYCEMVGRDPRFTVEEQTSHQGFLS